MTHCLFYICTEPPVHSCYARRYTSNLLFIPSEESAFLCRVKVAQISAAGMSWNNINTRKIETKVCDPFFFFVFLFFALSPALQLERWGPHRRLHAAFQWGWSQKYDLWWPLQHKPLTGGEKEGKSEASGDTHSSQHFHCILYWVSFIYITQSSSVKHKHWKVAQLDFYVRLHSESTLCALRSWHSIITVERI